MFCEKCGTQIQEDASFCTNCGAKLNKSVETNTKSEEKILDNEVELNVKPKFNLKYMTVPAIITYWGIFITLAILFGFITTAATAGIFMAASGMFVIGALFLGIALIFKKFQYDNYSYDFYKNI